MEYNWLDTSSGDESLYWKSLYKQSWKFIASVIYVLLFIINSQFTLQNQSNTIYLQKSIKYQNLDEKQQKPKIFLMN